MTISEIVTGALWLWMVIRAFIAEPGEGCIVLGLSITFAVVLRLLRSPR